MGGRVVVVVVSCGSDMVDGGSGGSKVGRVMVIVTDDGVGVGRRLQVVCNLTYHCFIYESNCSQKLQVPIFAHK